MPTNLREKIKNIENMPPGPMKKLLEAFNNNKKNPQKKEPVDQSQPTYQHEDNAEKNWDKLLDNKCPVCSNDLYTEPNAKNQIQCTVCKYKISLPKMENLCNSLLMKRHGYK